jgi:FMN phosphatase YigB (HAD superfamily)
MINTILFDLDGTLLPLEDKIFLNTYFGLMAKRFARLGYDKDEFIKAVVTGVKAMVENDGKVTNEVMFWNTFEQLVKGDMELLAKEFNEYYLHDFDYVKEATKLNPLSLKCISLLLEKGYQLVLATNPLFPQIATYKRIAWAGLEPTHFSLVTVYENSSFCKPNVKYYESILEKINKKPNECMMIGNDALEDMIASNLGIKTYLVTDYLINTKNIDIEKYQYGDFASLYEFIKDLPNLK